MGNVRKVNNMKAKKKISLDGTQVRSSVSSAKVIRQIAKELFNNHKEEHQAIKLNMPSSRVAIDFMIIATSIQASVKVPMQSPENNLWLRINKEIQQEA